MAAGRSTRVGAGPPKQYQPVGGVPMVLRALRPFVERPVIDAVIARARGGEGAVAAVRVSDTLKEASVEDPSLVVRTLPRDGLWRAQTPQGFPREVLERAHAAAPGANAATDDAALVERLGVPVRLVPD